MAMARDPDSTVRQQSNGRSTLDDMLVDAYRSMTVAEKWRRVSELNRALELLALADVKRRHPDADEQECRLRVASRRIPADLMRRAFGWDPAERGY
jgi:hypothetical protein